MQYRNISKTFLSANAYYIFKYLVLTSVVEKQPLCIQGYNFRWYLRCIKGQQKEMIKLLDMQHVQYSNDCLEIGNRLSFWLADMGCG